MAITREIERGHGGRRGCDGLAQLRDGARAVKGAEAGEGAEGPVEDRDVGVAHKDFGVLSDEALEIEVCHEVGDEFRRRGAADGAEDHVDRGIGEGGAELGEAVADAGGNGLAGGEHGVEVFVLGGEDCCDGVA